jgi:hypothetical protein
VPGGYRTKEKFLAGLNLVKVHYFVRRVVMNKRVAVLGLLVAIISVSALGSGFMGPPTAELEQGQFSVGYNFMYSDTDYDTMQITVLDSWIPEGGTPVSISRPGAKIKFGDVKVQRHYATISYGAAKWWEVYVQLGGADLKGKAKYPAETFSTDFGSDFAWGLGTKVTFCDQGNVRWGTSVQMNWLDSSTSSNFSEVVGAGIESGIETTSFDTFDLLIAVGPTVDMGGWKLYGGPFYYYVSGDYQFEQNGSSSSPGYSETFLWRESGDIEADSNFGAFIGTQLPLSDNVDMTAEFTFTGDSWAVGTGVTFKF